MLARVGFAVRELDVRQRRRERLEVDVGDGRAVVTRGVTKLDDLSRITERTMASASNALHVVSVGHSRNRQRHRDLVDRRADAVGERLQRVEVEAVHVGRGPAEHQSHLVLGGVGERRAQCLGGVRVAALAVGEVAAPHDPVDADLVPQRALRPAG